MDLQTAIDVIESVTGTTDESTPVGEAWAEILRQLHPRPQRSFEEAWAELGYNYGADALYCVRLGWDLRGDQ